MPNRVVKDKIWTSKKLSHCSYEAQLHYPRLYLLIDDWSCIEIDSETIRGNVYPKLLKHVTTEMIDGYLNEYWKEGLLFRWNDGNGREYGYFTGDESGRLPRIGRRHKRGTPEPPKDKLEEYINKNNEMTHLDAERRLMTQTQSPNPNPNPNHIPKRSEAALLDIKNYSTKKIFEEMELISKELYEERIFKEVFAFKNTACKKKINPKATLRALVQCKKNRPKEPWGYCTNILKVEDGNYNANDFMR